MKIMIIGDIIGKPGRHATREAIRQLKKDHHFDLVIANGENLAHGLGMTQKTFDEMRDAGVDFFTTGNHIYKRPEIFEEMKKTRTRVIRPANFPPNNIGHGYRLLKVKGKKILIINLIGRVFMDHNYDCPFRKMDEILDKFQKEKLDAIIVDFHAEATSEKIAMKHYLDGRVTALFGTHTHVMTADAEITNKGMAYISDVGMVGPKDSVIGVEKGSIMDSFLRQTSFKLEIASGPCSFNAIMIEIAGKLRAKSITSIQLTI